MSVDLGLDQNEIYEQYDKVMLNVFVGEAFAAWTLCQSHAFAKGSIICFAVGRVKLVHWEATFYTYGHAKCFETCCVQENGLFYRCIGSDWLRSPDDFRKSWRVSHARSVTSQRACHACLLSSIVTTTFRASVDLEEPTEDKTKLAGSLFIIQPP